MIESSFLISAIVLGGVTAYWAVVTNPTYVDERESAAEEQETRVEQMEAVLILREDDLDDREAEIDQRLGDIHAQTEVLEQILPQVDPEEPLPPPSRELSLRELHALWLRGYEAYENGELVLARESFERVLQSDPSYAPALNSLGRVSADLTGRGGTWVFRTAGSKAEDYFRRAIDADHNYVPAIVNLGFAHFWRGEYEVASALADKALRLRPGFDVALRLQNSIAKRRERARR